MDYLIQKSINDPFDLDLFRIVQSDSVPKTKILFRNFQISLPLPVMYKKSLGEFVLVE